jgi:AcrR family transcriptional regulator
MAPAQEKSREKSQPSDIASRAERRAGGRKPDSSRHAAILDAVIAILAETGYDGMTMDMVAVRAKAGKGAVYRRWPSKAAMVVDAVANMKRAQVDLENMRDTGTLRGDLLALFQPRSIAETDKKLRAASALTSLIAEQPSFAQVGHEALVTPWVEANRALFQRAIDRGEMVANPHLDTLAQMLPSMGAYRALIQRRAFDRNFLIEMLDGVLLPALGIGRSPPSPRSKRTTRKCGTQRNAASGEAELSFADARRPDLVGVASKGRVGRRSAVRP